MSADDEAVQVLRFWQAVSIFSPQSLPSVGSGAHVVDVLPGELMPWEPGSRLESEPVKSDQVWRHEVFGGVYKVRGVRDVLVRRLGSGNPGEDEQAPVLQESAIFACMVDAEGLLVEESAVLSACAWAVGQALTPGWPSTTWIDGFGQDILRYGSDLVKLVGAMGEDGIRALTVSMRSAIPAAVGQGVQVAVTGALAPVAGPLAAAGGAMAGSMARDLTKTATGAGPASLGAGPAVGTVRPLPRLGTHPLTGENLANFTAELADRLHVTKALAPCGIRLRSYLISVNRASEVPRSSFLNSFYIDDLKRVGEAFSTGGVGAALKAYLTVTRRLRLDERIDTRAEPLVMRAGARPRRIPLGRWPMGTDHALAFSQQFAVNQIMERLAENSGLLAVNGPPGTGKTTMLRDAVAAVVVERALRLAELAKPQDAFTSQPYKWQTATWTHFITAPLPALTGFEMVVASSNNGAVENITTQIPGRSAVADQWRAALGELGYFTQTAGLVSGNDAWAMIAAKLGRRSNCGEFVDRFWKGTFKESDPSRRAPRVGERRDRESADAGMQNVLRQMRTAGVDWPTAVADFRRALDKVRVLAAEREAVAAAIERRGGVRYEHKKLTGQVRAAEADIEALLKRQPGIDVRERQAHERWQTANSILAAHQQDKPGLLISLATWFRAGREWHAHHRLLREEAGHAENSWLMARAESEDLAKALAATRQQVQETQGRLGQIAAQLQNLLRHIDEARGKWGNSVPAGPQYWETSCTELIEERERSAPWADEEFMAARTELFIAALRLHKEFITALAPRISKNLNALMDILKGRSGQPEPDATLAAWQTLFLVVPVVSSTFASFDRLFAGLGRESLGWLYIDEAGQAAPHEAVGAIWRARRAVVVGDPLQLEPVVTLPWGGQQALLDKFGVPEEWAPSRSSVQGVADRLARRGTWLPGPSDPQRVWVGTPLRVHRRCDQPMFKICNQIAYGGLMVRGTPDRTGFYGRSAWCDVRSNEARGHWIPAEGRVLRVILRELKDAGIPPAEIRVLSPFRSVVTGAMNEYRDVFPAGEVSDKDLGAWVGTVHTMQGKEADVVILVLGTHPERVGSRRWAADHPNLLNVAVSRARRRLYVIGNRESWSGLSYFSVLAENMPDASPR